MRRSDVDHSRSSLNGRKEIQHSEDTGGDKFNKIFGFRLSDFTDTDRFVKLMTRPMDPASLGVMRVIFGLFMLLDTMQERGMSRAAQWADTERCLFPLFDSLRPLPVEWMVIVYICMATGAFGIMLGLFYRFSCLIFVIPYWYIFLLDKTRWNNHSYLFGLTGIILLFSDANRYWSIDGYIWKSKRHSHVPLWSYGLLRIQFFLVYFVAGLKKLDLDWVDGYSLRRLGDSWVFYPFQFILTSEEIDLYLVHKVGLIFDLTIGYFLFFDITRPIAMVFCGSFHLMNSQIFSIGMFPWTMFATMPLFCHADWPRRIFRKMPSLSCILPSDQPLQPNEHCLYPKEQVKSEENDSPNPSHVSRMRSKASRYHKFMVGLVMTYLSWQLFMPYSHFITKGYNSWTEGLYGYSWDMMIHTWSSQHVKITYVDKDTGEVGYLHPGVGTSRDRWSSQPDMMKQYATCLASKLKRDFNVTNPALYFDIWRSMNKRFQQRMFDPRVDILSAPWNAFSDTPWLFPILSELSEWRDELMSSKVKLREAWKEHHPVFIADFPGLKLDLFIQEDFTNATVKLLRGSVVVALGEEKNHTLSVGQTLKLPPGLFHNIYTVSNQSSCLLLLYVNNTRLRLQEKAEFYEAIINKTSSLEQASDEDIESIISDIQNEDEDEKLRIKKILNMKREHLIRKKERAYGITSPFRTMVGFVTRKTSLVYNTTRLAVAGVQSVLTGKPLGEIVPDIMKDTIASVNKKNKLD